MVEAPDLDQVQIYRFHRQLLAAHCMEDADMIAQLTAPEVVIVDRGELHRTSRKQTRERFSGTFERLNYTEYHDIAAPVIEVSASEDIGWIAVNVRAVGSENVSGAPFDSQWARTISANSSAIRYTQQPYTSDSSAICWANPIARCCRPV